MILKYNHNLVGLTKEKYTPYLKVMKSITKIGETMEIQIIRKDTELYNKLEAKQFERLITLFKFYIRKYNVILKHDLKELQELYDLGFYCNKLIEENLQALETQIRD
jgi:predicted patatin/cPLA2 family phospholipase